MSDPMVTRGRLDVTREAEFAVRRWTFRYDANGHTLRCSGYEAMWRETRRHKWRSRRRWSDADTRAKRPPIPADVAEEALQAFRDGLTVEMT